MCFLFLSSPEELDLAAAKSWCFCYLANLNIVTLRTFCCKKDNWWCTICNSSIKESIDEVKIIRWSRYFVL
jgi:hypothetical protein